MTEQYAPQGSSDQFVHSVAQLVSAFGRGQDQELRPAQKHLILQFRALRNGLGNYGEHWETPDRAILASPDISPGNSRNARYTLTFVEPLPAGAASIVLRYPHPPFEVLYPVGDIDDEYWELPIVDPEVNSVEVWDLQREPLAVGVPHFHDEEGTDRRKKQATVTGRAVQSPPSAASSSGRQSRTPANAKD